MPISRYAWQVIPARTTVLVIVVTLAACGPPEAELKAHAPIATPTTTPPLATPVTPHPPATEETTSPEATILEASLSDLSASMASGRISAVQLVDAYIA